VSKPLRVVMIGGGITRVSGNDSCAMLPLHCPGEPNVVTNDCARSDWLVSLFLLRRLLAFQQA